MKHGINVKLKYSKISKFRNLICYNPFKQDHRKLLLGVAEKMAQPMLPEDTKLHAIHDKDHKFWAMVHWGFGFGIPMLRILINP